MLRDLPDVGLDVVVDVSPVGLVGRGTDLHLGVILEPDIHPLPHGVFLGFCLIYDLCFLNSLLQFGPGLRLGPAQDVPVNGLPRLRVMAYVYRPSQRPSLRFRRLPSPLALRFAMLCRLLCNDIQYHRNRKWPGAQRRVIKQFTLFRWESSLSTLSHFPVLRRLSFFV